ncbi:1,2-dihydroxy-3-keto-5-methylthiopentene dioxygenase [Saxophila tyrrhenica]|uniref:1,2-dihydroxy-3-keto-5-methylthiopentene dioxygenase n=1 Tax=Saxophila tyrrhenica TaxID=1690608 RepID=A0AAV9P5P9_9PEZI|nr:1,2-dihydroxy-3-keto-5-methylthiopentene dioxygenase [Saxophila tyrrhenica]
MRFLQIEWHNHERARNSWAIERAEMKAKIAKQEGECRQAKRINEQLVRQIQMLQKALKSSREQNGVTVNGTGRVATPDQAAGEKSKEGHQKVEHGDLKGGSDWRAEDGHELTLGKALHHNSFLQTGAAEAETGDKAREEYLDNTRKYLKECMQQIQYLLTPPPHPPPQALPNGTYQTGLPEPPPSVEDIYARNNQRWTRQQGQALPQASSMPNHQPPPPPNNVASAQEQAMSRGPSYADYQAPSHPPPESRQQNTIDSPAPFEDQVESVTHTFDSNGRAVPTPPEQTRQIRQQPEADGWTFDDEPPRSENAPSDMPAKRPDTDLFPTAAGNTHLSAKSPPRTGSISHRRKSSGSQAMSRRRSSQGKAEAHDAAEAALANSDPSQFKVKFALRGHLDVVRSAIFSGGGSPSEPEVCTAGDDGTIKRWIIPGQSYQNFNSASNTADLDVAAYFTHRGHDGIVTSLSTCPASTGFSTGGRASGDGWIFSGGQDATVRVWERGRVDPKATLEGHTDAVWSVCVLPASVGVVFGPECGNFGGPDRLLLVSGSADGTVKVWAVSAPPQTSSPSTGSRRGVGGSRRHSVTSGSNFTSEPQPSVASSTPFSYTLVHSIEKPITNRDTKGSPTSICPLSASGDTFVVSYTDSSVFIFDTRTGEMLSEMQSFETYDGTMDTSINAVVATSLGMEGSGPAIDASRGLEAEEVGAGATGSREGVEGVVISGHEDRFVRFFDANSGQATYTMLAHPAAISALSLSKDGREAVSAGHDASIRFWSLEKRICTQDIVSHRAMRGEGVCDVAWSQDGRLVVSAGGDGVVKVFAR